MAALGVQLGPLSEEKAKSIKDVIKKVGVRLSQNYPSLSDADINDMKETLINLTQANWYDITIANDAILAGSIYYVYLSRRRGDLPQPAYASSEMLNSPQTKEIINNIKTGKSEKNKKITEQFYQAELLRFAQLITDFLNNPNDDGLYSPLA